MTTIKTEELRQRAHDYRHEPTRVMNAVLGVLEDQVEGVGGVVMTPGQPLPFLLETVATLTAAAVDSIEASTMRQYPVMAQVEDDLYLHLSDRDMYGMFATPSEAYFTFLFSKAEILANAVSILDSASRKLTIPKHTAITVNGLVFTMQYPINIIIKPHGGFDIVYDGSVSSPIQTINGNQVDWSISRFRTQTAGQSANEFIRIRVPIKQVAITSFVSSSNPTQMFKATYTFNDQFVYCRAFRETSNGWVEMKTTHSDHTFDPNDPTLQLRVSGQQLHVELPYVYQMSSMSSARIRVDIYSTAGNQYMDLSALTPDSFVATWADLDKTDNGRYYAPLSQLETLAILSDDTVSGGSDSPSFQERRERVLTNSIGPSTKPISPSQVKTTLETLGFDVALNTDDALGRTFKVSRTMPDNPYGISTAPIDSAVLTAKSSMDEMVQLDTTRLNELRLTVLPSTLYKDVNGTLVICDDQERLELDQLRPEAKANRLSMNNYLYTPLHYVLDANNNQFKVRPYYLTNPTMDISGYSAANETVAVSVQSSTDIYITYTDEGYAISLLTDSNEAYKALADSQCHVQLAFKPDVETELVYVNGELVRKEENGERFFRFRMDTNWDIDPNHLLTLTNFTMRVDEEQQHHTHLKGEWFIIWSVSDYTIDGMAPSEVDEELGRHLLPQDVIGVYRETIKVRLGDELTGLWSRSRPMIGTLEYRKHLVDVPLLYSSNIYEIDPDTNLPKVVEIDGRRQLVVQHAKGDPVLDVNGDPEYLYRANDPMRDEHGQLIPLSARTVMWWWDVVLFDAQYRYVTRQFDVEYANTVADVLAEWINDTLTPLKEMALERTEFSFQPRNSLKFIPVMVDEGVYTNIYSSQRLVIDIFLTDSAYREAELRTNLDVATRTVIRDYLNNTRVSVDGLVTAIKEAMGEDAVTVTVSGLGDANYSVITLQDVTTRLCVAKILSLEADGSLAIKDDITINFKRHGS